MADEGRKRKMQRKKGANLMKNLLKKIGALLVAAVMVLSMCTAVFADGNATIKLTGFNTADSVEYMQIIQKDESTFWLGIYEWSRRMLHRSIRNDRFR